MTLRELGGGALRGMLFCEFDHIVGHKITFQLPARLISADVFDAIHEYVITKPNICGRLMTITSFDWKVMGLPLCLEGPKYPRNMIIWNICFVFSSEEADEVVAPYEPLLRKLQHIFMTLEQEAEFVLRNKQLVQEIVEKVYHGLRANGECRIPVDPANTIYLKLAPRMKPPGVVKAHEVPVLLCELNPVDHAGWDLSLQQVIPYIDGVNHIKRIAHYGGVDVDVAKKCVQHLIFHGCVKMMDIFQYSNVYVTTPLIKNLATDKEMQKKCLDFIALPGHVPPPIETVFSLYCSLQRGTTMLDFCRSKQIASLHIDERKFTAFGIINGFIRRIHKYPLKLVGRKEGLPPSSKNAKMQQMLNGQTPYDQICTTLGRSYENVDSTFYADKDIVILSK